MFITPSVMKIRGMQFVTNPTRNSAEVRSYATSVWAEQRIAFGINAVVYVAFLGLLLWTGSLFTPAGLAIALMYLAAGLMWALGFLSYRTICGVPLSYFDSSMLVRSRHEWEAVTEAVRDNGFATASHHALWDAAVADERIMRLRAERKFRGHGDVARQAREDLDELKLARADAIRLVVELTGTPVKELCEAAPELKGTNSPDHTLKNRLARSPLGSR